MVAPEASRADGDPYGMIDADLQGETLVGHSTIEAGFNWKLIARVPVRTGMGLRAPEPGGPAGPRMEAAPQIGAPRAGTHGARP